MYVFTPKCDVQFVMFYTSCAKHASAGTLIHASTTNNLLDFYTTKLSSIYGHKPIVTKLLGLNAAISEHSQLVFFSVLWKSC